MLIEVSPNACGRLECRYNAPKVFSVRTAFPLRPHQRPETIGRGQSVAARSSSEEMPRRLRQIAVATP